MENKRAFTLIELLVVIAVMAGLMALLVPNFMQVRVKSRDMRRKSDLAAIQKALELYKLNQSPPSYPTSAAVVACTSLSDANGVYMATIPQDPLSQCVAPVSYYYSRNAVDSTKYTLCACLENPNDTDQKAPVTCAGATACSGGKYYKLNEP